MVTPMENGYLRAWTFIFLLLFVPVVLTAIEVMLVEEDILDYGYKSTKSYEGPDYDPDDQYSSRYTVFYTDTDNAQYPVHIADFRELERLDSHINGFVKRSRGTLQFGNHTIFIEQKNDYVFWRSGTIFIRISQKIPDFSTLEEFNEFRISNGTGEFPDAIIGEYLKLYPSECDDVSCSPPDSKEILRLRKQVNLSKTPMLYQGVYVPCRKAFTREEVAEKIHKITGDISHISSRELDEMYVSCNENKYFSIQAKEKEPWLIECMNELNATMSQSTSEEVSEIKLIGECLLRDSFKDKIEAVSNESYEDDFFDDVFEEWDALVVDELERKKTIQRGPQRIIEKEPDGSVVKKQISIKENCLNDTALNETEPTTIGGIPFDCVEEEIIETLQASDFEDEKEVVAPEIDPAENNENFVKKIFRFIRSKLNI